MGAADAGRQARTARDPGEGALVLPRGEVPGATATSSRATSPRARSSRSASTGYGVDGKRQVYLDLTHIPRKSSTSSSAASSRSTRSSSATDPREVPMKVFPGMHYSMGGLWVDFAEGRERAGSLDESSLQNQATNVPGSTPGGEVDFSIHGANRLGRELAASPASTPGRIGGPAMVPLRAREGGRSCRLRTAAFRRGEEALGGEFARLAGDDGPENPHVIAEEMGDWMTDNVTVVRENGKLAATETKLAGAAGTLEPDRPDGPPTFANR